MTRSGANAPKKAARSMPLAAGVETPRAQGESNIVLVDGSNVAHSTEGEKPLIENLFAVRDKLKDEGLEPVIVADAALRHRIDDPARYERMIEAGEVRQA